VGGGDWARRADFTILQPLTDFGFRISDGGFEIRNPPSEIDVR